MKKIKMLLYGEPGAGKSVFACHAPKPFFICTDGNYEWLEDFGAKEKDHVNVTSWKEIQQVLKSDFNDYDTIVIDLLEDAFKWCEQEYCTRNRIEHVSDVGYGKAYDSTRNEFFIEISKLLAKDKHVILICHGISFTTKDRRGVEHMRYAPSSRIPDKVLDMIEGRVRYCLRCYIDVEETDNGQLKKVRKLSLVPKENEFGIIRGVDENTIPQTIDLDFDEFANIIGLNMLVSNTSEETIEEKPKRRKRRQNEAELQETSNIVEDKAAEKYDEPEPEKIIEAIDNAETKSETIANTNATLVDKLAAIKAKKEQLDKINKIETAVEQSNVVVISDDIITTNEQPKINEDKLAAIRAKIAAAKANMNK